MYTLFDYDDRRIDCFRSVLIDMLIEKYVDYNVGC